MTRIREEGGDVVRFTPFGLAQLRAALREPREPPPEVDFCSRCHEHTTFAWDEFEGAFLSVCCGARPINVDREPDDA